MTELASSQEEEGSLPLHTHAQQTGHGKTQQEGIHQQG